MSEELSRKPPPEGGRIAWVDTARGVAAFLVVLGHTTASDPVMRYVYAFHIPLFLFLAGLMSHGADPERIYARFERRARLIVKSYLVFSVISYVVWVLFARAFGSPVHRAIAPWVPIVGTFYGVGTSDWMPHNTVLWFLPCLLCTEAIAALMIRCRVSRFTYGAVALLIILEVWFFPHAFRHRAPLSFDSALYGLPFYLAGLMFYPQLARFLRRAPFSLQRALGAFIMGTLAVSVPVIGRFDIAAVSAGVVPPLTYVQGAFGIAGVCLLAASLPFLHVPFTEIGRNSLVIFGLHNLVDSVLLHLAGLVLGVDRSVLREDFFGPLAFSILNVIIILTTCGWLTDYLRRDGFRVRSGASSANRSESGSE